MDNNQLNPPNPVPPAQARPPAIEKAPRFEQPKPKPQTQTGLTKTRDILLNNDRVISFGLTNRNFPRLYEFNQEFSTNLVELYSHLFQSNWNQGFNSIVPAVAAQAILAQCESYARCYIHSFLCDLYSSIREVARTESPSIFLAAYLQEMPRTGHPYDPFLRQVFNMLHPILCDKYLEETLYYPHFDIDMNRNHNNTFDLVNVGANDISTTRMFAISDTLSRSRSLTTGALQFGTKRGNGASLIDFYPIEEDVKSYAATWLNMDNNYNDDALAVMYVIGTDVSLNRLGPFTESDRTADRAIRNALDPPFHAEYIEVSDTNDQGFNSYHVDEDNVRVDTYNEARNSVAEYVPMYRRTWYFYRKKILQNLIQIDRFNAFKQIVEG